MALSILTGVEIEMQLIQVGHKFAGPLPKSLSLNLFLLYSPLYMEEDTKGIRKENFALSLNIRLVQ